MGANDVDRLYSNGHAGIPYPVLKTMTQKPRSYWTPSATEAVLHSTRSTLLRAKTECATASKRLRQANGGADSR